MQLLRRIWRDFGRTLVVAERANLGLSAAGVAFFAAFAVFPGLAALIALFGLVADPSVVESQLALMHDIIPAEVFRLLAAEVQSLLQTRPETLGWTTLLSIGVALWSARAGVGAMMIGLNAVHGRRNLAGLGHYALAFVLTLALVAISILALALVVLAPVVLAFLPLGPAGAVLVQATRWAAALIVMLTGLALLYRYGPTGGGHRWRILSPGAVMVVVLWTGASVGVSVYLSNFAAYNQVYGSIGAVIALLLWLYITAYLVLLGAALDEVLSS